MGDGPSPYKSLSWEAGVIYELQSTERIALTHGQCMVPSSPHGA